jgi:hypothetical protein
MKIFAAAIALAITTPAAAFDNHQAHGEGHDAMMCCEGTAEEREACRERHRAMSHEVADCDAEHSGHHMNHGDAAHEGHEMGGGQGDHAEHSDEPSDDE